MTWRCRLFGHTWARLEPDLGFRSPRQCVVCGAQRALRPWPPPPPPPPPPPSPLTWTSIEYKIPRGDGTVARGTLHELDSRKVRLRVVPNVEPDPAEEAARRGVLL
jgi:hypothetical protein